MNADADDCVSTPASGASPMMRLEIPRSKCPKSAPDPRSSVGSSVASIFRSGLALNRKTELTAEARRRRAGTGKPPADEETCRPQQKGFTSEHRHPLCGLFSLRLCVSAARMYFRIGVSVRPASLQSPASSPPPHTGCSLTANGSGFVPTSNISDPLG